MYKQLSIMESVDIWAMYRIDILINVVGVVAIADFGQSVQTMKFVLFFSRPYKNVFSFVICNLYEISCHDDGEAEIKFSLKCAVLNPNTIFPR